MNGWERDTGALKTIDTALRSIAHHFPAALIGLREHNGTACF